MLHYIVIATARNADETDRRSDLYISESNAGFPTENRRLMTYLRAEAMPFLDEVEAQAALDDFRAAYPDLTNWRVQANDLSLVDLSLRLPPSTL